VSTDTLDPIVPAPPPGLLARTRASRWLPLPVVLAGTFMVVLDFFIVNVALPSIQSGLHTSSGTLEWTSGVLATAQNVGDSIGEAVIGVVFFGALHHGFAHAFELGVGLLAAILIAVAGLTRLMPAAVRS
jgi:hypothetical protein